MAGGIDPTEHRPQPAGLDAAGDRTAAHAGAQQLLTADDAVLTIGEIADHPVAVCGAFDTHLVYKAPATLDSPPGAG